jgi:hypothetical protein
MRHEILLYTLSIGLAFTFTFTFTFTRSRSALAAPPKLTRRAKTPVTWVKSFFQTRRLRRTNRAADRAFRRSWKDKNNGDMFPNLGEGRSKTASVAVGAIDTAVCVAASPAMPALAIPMALGFGAITKGYEKERQQVVARSRVSSMVGAIKDGVRVNKLGSTSVHLHRRALREALREELKQAKDQTTFRRVGTALSTLDKARRTDVHRLAAKIIKGSRLGWLGTIGRHMTEKPLWRSSTGNRVTKDELVNELVTQRDFLIQAQQRSAPRKVAAKKIGRIDAALAQLFKRPWGIENQTFVRVARSGALAKTIPGWRGNDLEAYRMRAVRGELEHELKRTDKASDPVGHRNLAEALTVFPQ